MKPQFDDTRNAGFRDGFASVADRRFVLRRRAILKWSRRRSMGSGAVRSARKAHNLEAAGLNPASPTSQRQTQACELGRRVVRKYHASKPGCGLKTVPVAAMVAVTPRRRRLTFHVGRPAFLFVFSRQPSVVPDKVLPGPGGWFCLLSPAARCG